MYSNVLNVLSSCIRLFVDSTKQKQNITLCYIILITSSISFPNNVNGEQSSAENKSRKEVMEHILSYFKCHWMILWTPTFWFPQQGQKGGEKNVTLIGWGAELENIDFSKVCKEGLLVSIDMCDSSNISIYYLWK